MSPSSCKAVFTLAAGLFVAGAPIGGTVAFGQEKPTTPKIITVDGVKLNATFYPSSKKNSPVVIMVHPIGEGKSSKSPEWKSMAEYLQSKDFAVITFDLRGHGDSTTVDPDVFWGTLTKKGDMLTAAQQWARKKVKQNPKETDVVDVKDFIKSTDYLPALANDIAAVRAYLDRQNETGDCNTGNIFVIGADTGATLAAIWINSEWSRFKVTPNPMAPKLPVIDKRAEGADITGAVFLTIQPFLQSSKKIKVSTVLKNACLDHGMGTVFIYGKEDKDAATLAMNLEKSLKVQKSKKHEFIQAFPRDTNLSGVKLLQNGLMTEKEIASWFTSLIDDRGGEWAQRDFVNTSYIWQVNALRHQAHRKGEKNLEWQSYKEFAGQWFVSAELRLDNVCKTFAPPSLTLKDVTFTVAPGECLALVGPSGCGKTTLLRIIAGIEQATSGDIRLDNQRINEVPCHRRGIAMLFQRPALIPKKTVRYNLGWASALRRPLRTLFGAGPQLVAQLLRVARLLELDNDLDRPVQTLSGGQQQRVALGRCLMRDAKICLLDEPLGHLDVTLRRQLRRQIRMLAREFNVTTIHVTHDPEEVLAAGDRVAVMQEGAIVQNDDPAKVRRNPANRFVAELVLHPDGGLNLVNGSIVRADAEIYFESVFGRWPVSLHLLPLLRESLYLGENFHASSGKVDMLIGIAVRDVRSGSDVHADDGEVSLRMAVGDCENAAAGNRVIAANECGSWIGRTNDNERMERGQAVTMAFSMDRAFWFDRETGRTLVAPP